MNKFLKFLKKVFVPKIARRGWSKVYLYKLKEPLETFDYYQKRIIELSDGRTVRDTINTLYQEIPSLGLFKGKWQEEMFWDIEKLIKRGYIKKVVKDSRSQE